MRKSALSCGAEFKRSWLNDPGRAVVAVSAAKLVPQCASAMRHMAIEVVGWILFIDPKLLSRRDSRTKPMDVFLTSFAVAVLSECCRLDVSDGIPPTGGPGIAGHSAATDRRKDLTTVSKRSGWSY